MPCQEKQPQTQKRNVIFVMRIFQKTTHIVHASVVILIASLSLPASRLFHVSFPRSRFSYVLRDSPTRVTRKWDVWHVLYLWCTCRKLRSHIVNCYPSELSLDCNCIFFVETIYGKWCLTSSGHYNSSKYLSSYFYVVVFRFIIISL